MGEEHFAKLKSIAIMFCRQDTVKCSWSAEHTTVNSSPDVACAVGQWVSLGSLALAWVVRM